MTKKNTILYLGSFDAFNKNAAGKRVLEMAKLISSLGFDVVLLGLSKSNNFESIEKNKSIIEGISIYSFSNHIVKNRLNYNAFFSDFKYFYNHNLKEQVCAIFLYGSPTISLFNLKVINFARKRNIKVISDVVDWLSPSSGGLAFKVFKHFDTWFLKSIITPKSDGIIAISEWLMNYYRKKGIKNILLIPPLSESSNIDFQCLPIPNILYAGTPFRVGQKNINKKLMKDRIDKSISLLRKVKEKGCVFKYHVYGFNKNDLLISLPYLTKDVNYLDDSIVFHGKVTMETIHNDMSFMDYSLLIRDNNRVSNAGFPSKVSESISFGVPVITTKTSDISKYLRENESVFFLLDNPKENIDILEKALKISPIERAKMRTKCLINNPFDGSLFKDHLNQFIELIEIKNAL